MTSPTNPPANATREMTRADLGLRREWLVIESAYARAVFRDDADSKPTGYIPRDAAEELLGRSMEGRVWFSRQESDLMRAHPEWRHEEP